MKEKIGVPKPDEIFQKTERAKTPEVENELEKENIESEQGQLASVRKSLRRSSVSRVVGLIAEEKKERVLDKSEKIFDQQFLEEFEGREREKTAEEIEIISLVNEATNKLREEYGLSPLDIPPKNFHVIKDAKRIREDMFALYSSFNQAVVMGDSRNRLFFMSQALHEMLHFKSYNAWQAEENATPRVYRAGLRIKKIGEEREYFRNFNEAMTEELAKRLFGGISGHDIFEEEAAETKKAISSKKQVKISEQELVPREDIVYAEEWGGLTLGEKIKSFFGRGKKGYLLFGYKRERAVLNNLIDKLFEKNKDKFSGREEVFKLFAAGYMTGNIMPLGRLVEKTFGKGTLRELGELGNDIDEQEKFVNSL